MKKRFLAWTITFAMVLTMLPTFALTAFADAAQDALNTRTTPAPTDTSGLIKMKSGWDTNIAVFSDETAPTSGQVSTYVGPSRLTMSTGHDWYICQMFNANLDGNFSFRNSSLANYAAGNAYMQYDFGISTNINRLDVYYRIMRPDSNVDYVNPIAKKVRIDYSDDNQNWTQSSEYVYDLSSVDSMKNFYSDTDAANMVSAYNTIQAYIAGGKTGDFPTAAYATLKKPCSYKLAQPVTARYFRYVVLMPTQNEASIYDLYIQRSNWYDMSQVAFNGEGTVAYPFLINNQADLIKLATNTNAGNDFAGLYFKLTADIDLANSQWTPIGNKTTHFKGNFNGNGHIISNLAIGTSVSRNIALAYPGLFGYIEGNTVKNVGVVYVNLYCASSDGNPRIGAITGYNSGTIDSCYAKNIFISNTSTGVAGGIAGDNNGSILNSYVGGTNNYIQASRAGGIAGDNESAKVIQNCYTVGYTTIITTGTQFDTKLSGPIVGNSANNTTITNCYYNYSGTLPNMTGTSKTLDEFANGSVATLLGSAYKQVGSYPELLSFNKTEYAIGTISNVGGVATVPVTKNVTGTALLIIAAYSGNQLVAVKSYDISSLNGTDNYTLTNNESNVKAFIWNNLSNVKPLL